MAGTLQAQAVPSCCVGSGRDQQWGHPSLSAVWPSCQGVHMGVLLVQVSVSQSEAVSGDVSIFPGVDGSLYAYAASQGGEEPTLQVRPAGTEPCVRL